MVVRKIMYTYIHNIHTYTYTYIHHIYSTYITYIHIHASYYILYIHIYKTYKTYLELPRGGFPDFHGAGLVSHCDLIRDRGRPHGHPAGPGDRRLAHAPHHHCRMGGHSAVNRKHSDGSLHVYIVCMHVGKETQTILM